MVDTKPLLKGFGAGADVVGQIATDKAVNARRQTNISSEIALSASATAFDNSEYTSALRASDSNPTNGELALSIETNVSPKAVEHGLGRIPSGAFIIGTDAAGEWARFLRGAATTTEFSVISAGTGAIVDMWVF
jgi:hypothetical protein